MNQIDEIGSIQTDVLLKEIKGHLFYKIYIALIRFNFLPVDII